MDEPDVVEGIVLMRKYESSLPTLEKVNAKIDELNDTPGRLLPGVQLDRIFDLSRLIHVTDTLGDPKAPVLGYGKTKRVGPFTCTSRRTGLSCHNRNGHGFTVSRERQTVH